MVEGDEEETVAAAATAVIMGAPIIIATVAAAADESASEERPPKLDFIANLPFIFFLRDLQTGLLLFQGRLVNPSG